MTTKELKQYIDKVLGNSIRCLLPSYWWKRLFGMVVDKVDEVEDKTVAMADIVDELKNSNAKIILVDIYNNKANEDNAKAFSSIKSCATNGKPYVVVGGNGLLTYISESAWFVDTEREELCSLSFRGYGYEETTEGTTKRKHYTAALYADGHVVLGTAVDSAIDSRLSDTSENPVQNKAVKAYVDEKVANVDIDTSDLATKEDLNAYATSESLQSLGLRIQNDMDTDKRELTEAINTKQDKIDDLEAIRGGAALGATALQEHQDISHLATKDEVENVISELIDDEEVIAHSLNDLNDRVNNIAGELSGDFASKEEVDAAIETLTNADAANQQAIESVSGNVSTLTERVDNIASELTEDFATKDEVQTAIANLTNEVINDEEVLAHAINDLNDRLNAIGEGGGSSSGMKNVLIQGGTLDIILKPNERVISFGTPISNLTISGFEVTPFSDENPIDNADSWVDEYCVVFKTDAVPIISLTLPDYVLWANGMLPEMEQETVYELSITRYSLHPSDSDTYYKAVLTPFKVAE